MSNWFRPRFVTERAFRPTWQEQKQILKAECWGCLAVGVNIGNLGCLLEANWIAVSLATLVVAMTVAMALIALWSTNRAVARVCRSDKYKWGTLWGTGWVQHDFRNSEEDGDMDEWLPLELRRQVATLQWTLDNDVDVRAWKIDATLRFVLLFERDASGAYPAIPVGLIFRVLPEPATDTDECMEILEGIGTGRAERVRLLTTEEIEAWHISKYSK